MESLCNNGAFCDGVEICSPTGPTPSGCLAGAPPCGDQVDCTQDTCSEIDDECVYTPVHSRCDDGNACDGLETCSATAGCVSGNPVVCSDDGHACTLEACNPTTGACGRTFDSGLCTAGRFCTDQGCQTGMPCTGDTECQDGSECNGPEVCDLATTPGVCRPGAAVVCNDGLACTLDQCNEPTTQGGQATCAHAPIDSFCGGDLCNMRFCDPTPGTGGCKDDIQNCDDGIACTNDRCFGSFGCLSTPIDSVCGDNLVCNGQERCDELLGCQPGAPPSCPDDGIACTAAVCIEPGGCAQDDSACACTQLGAFCDPSGSSCCSGACREVGLAEPVCVTPGAGCEPVGQPCAAAIDCCNLACSSGVCQASGGCTSIGQSCASSSACCSNNCSGTTCGPGGGGCLASGQTCQNDENCCSGTCSNGACLGTGSACRATGEVCTTDSQCCSSRCTSNRCERLPFCRPSGEPCASADQCCSLVCSGGYCAKLGWCRPSFEPCTGDDMECCSGRCSEDQNGIPRCLPIGACRPSGPVLTGKGVPNQFGEICGSGCDCCSELCEADGSGILRCRKLGNPTCGSGQVKLKNGEICESDCQCISGICKEPRPPDTGGQFPKRCLDTVPGGSGCKGSGEACADPGQCCNGLCLADTDACGFSCGGGGTGGTGGSGGTGGTGGSPCVPIGGACTTRSDCCQGSCIPDGQGGLVCGFVG